MLLGPDNVRRATTMQSAETLARVDNVVQDAQRRCRDVQEHLKKALSALTTVAMNLEPGSSGPVRSFSTLPVRGRLQVVRYCVQTYLVRNAQSQ